MDEKNEEIEEKDLDEKEPQKDDAKDKKPEKGDEDNGGSDGSSSSEGGTVNRHKYEREIGKRDKRIKELEAENAKYKDTSDKIDALTKRIDEAEAKAQADKVASSLEAAGCIDVKAACARLDEFDDDIDKLKEAVPYLFASADNTKKTGGNPKGKAGNSDDEDEILDKAFGLK